MVSFGWSVGDVVALSQLLAKIIKALKDNRTASSEYSQLTRELELLRTLLSDVSQKPPKLHQPLIQGVALGSRTQLENFLKKIQSQYESTLAGKPTSRSKLAIFAKRAQWAVITQSDVTQLRMLLASTIQIVQFALTMELSSDTATTQTLLSNSFTRLNDVSTRSENKITELKQEQDQLRTQLITGFGNVQDGQKRVFDTATEQFRGLMVDFHGLSSSITTRIGLMQQSLDCIKQLMEQLVSAMREYPAKIYMTMYKILLVCMNILLLLGKIHERLPARVSGLLSSNVTFEDALGRVKSLSYEGFNYWEVFKRMLECDFKGLPGYEKVIRGRYHILRSSDQRQIDRDDWKKFFHPGESFQMSIILEKQSRTEATISICPRCTGRGKFERRCGAFSLYSCCGMFYFDHVVMSRPSRPTLRKLKAIAEDDSNHPNDRDNEGDGSNKPPESSHKLEEEPKRKQPERERHDRKQERENLYSFKRVHFFPTGKEPEGDISKDIEDVRLVKMALFGDHYGIQDCLNSGANINAFVKINYTLLKDAGLSAINEKRWRDRTLSPIQAASTRIDTLKLLVDLGADITSEGGYFGNVLQAAARNGCEETVRYLVENGADVNAHGRYFRNTLQAAAQGGNEEIVRYLVENCADVNVKDRFWGGALQAAALSGHKEIVRYLVVENGVDVNVKDGIYGSVLQAAAHRGREEIVRYLVEKGADVNAKGGNYGSALQAAAHHGPEEIVRYLVEKGADVNAKGGNYGSALQAAAHHGPEEIVRYLVEKGADVNAKGGEYGSALQAARNHIYRWGNREIISYLIENGATEDVS